MEPNHSSQTSARGSRKWPWLLLLAAPYIGLLWPPLYAHTEPVLWGFPFFYWYQFAWTIIMAPLTWLVYVRSK